MRNAPSGGDAVLSEVLDVVVIGLGVTGAASTLELARRGVRVLGIDHFTPPHTHGSSHGDTRITREIYFENPLYVPLVQRANALWRELEAWSGQPLLLQTGGLNIGAADSDVAAGAAASARTHELPHEVLTAEEVQRRFPALRPDDDMIGIYEPAGGVLLPESCIAALHKRARQSGAVLQYDELVADLQPTAKSVRVVTTRSSYTTRRVVLAAGSWLPRLLPDLELPLMVERQVTLHFASEPPGVYAAERFPFTLWQSPGGETLYTVPDVGIGMKAALHHGGEAVDPDHVRREVDDEEVRSLRALVSHYFPHVAGPPIRSGTCLYTTTPDNHFIIDLHPREPRIVIASACSGHGFKFGPAIGEIVADLALGAAPPWNIAPFAISRFAPAAGVP